MKIIAFAGSSSIHSINKQLVTFVSSKAAADLNVEVEMLDLNDYDIPLYSIDKEKRGEVPPEVHTFIAKLQQADGIILSLAEHNGTYTAVFKNLMDWASRIELNFFNNSPMFLMSTSPGGYGGGNVMEAALVRLPKFQANIVSSFKLPKFGDNFSAENGILDNELKADFEEKYKLFRGALIN
jgi:NAD(P)H-dependent FMN reductase